MEGSRSIKIFKNTIIEVSFCSPVKHIANNETVDREISEIPSGRT